MKTPREKEDKTPREQTNLQGVVEAWRIPLVGSLWGIFSMVCRLGLGRPRRHGGIRYPFDRDGFAWFIQDVCENWFVETAPALMGLTPRQMQRADVRDRVDRFVAAVLRLSVDDLNQIAAEVADPEPAAGEAG